jgi:hypothetical protein
MAWGVGPEFSPSTTHTHAHTHTHTQIHLPLPPFLNWYRRVGAMMRPPRTGESALRHHHRSTPGQKALVIKPSRKRKGSEAKGMQDRNLWAFLHPTDCQSPCQLCSVQESKPFSRSGCDQSWPDLQDPGDQGVRTGRDFPFFPGLSWNSRELKIISLQCF